MGIIKVGDLCVQSQEDYSTFWHVECKSDPKRRMVETVRRERQISKTEKKTKTRSLVRWL
jgi:hypothetical protein